MAVNLDIQNLIDLIDELRYAGYDIGTQQYIAAQNLLIALAARGELPQDLRSLRTWLAPVICSSPREQENFYRYFDRWIASHPELTMPAAAEGRPLPAGERIDHPERDWRDFLRQPAFALAVTVLLISVGVALLFWMRPRTQQLSGTVIDNDTNQRVSGAAISFNGQTKTTDNNGAFSVTYKSQELPKDLTVANVGYETTTVQVTSQTKSPIEIRLQQPQPPPSPLPAGEGTP
ncbi:MAG TPA: carboxypeptidase-like regulatory domain-containing protein, partial [Pyrinomonadaceae bacterium]|nr:carboxypeptidase-like regulatory domain-containing protein [Pyrinomonadaceae bacterium]